MQFDADHLFALAGYAEADHDIMANHIRNGVPAIAEREYADTIEVLRMFKGDAEWAWLADKLRDNVRKMSRAVAVYRSNPSHHAPPLGGGSVHGVVGTEIQGGRK
ncbi:MAG: hypothetical protein BWY57_03241 [Betaproteobacteria bacterium ADurb.Bin341]|nr:MAG: hypothetical protein BWY57_03241 [Betaproteobacteria bacterium ADurb.Bin341]